MRDDRRRTDGGSSYDNPEASQGGADAFYDTHFGCGRSPTGWMLAILLVLAWCAHVGRPPPEVAWDDLAQLVDRRTTRPHL